MTTYHTNANFKTRVLMKKLIIATLLCLSLGTIECRQPRAKVQEEIVEVTPWYFQYKFGALIGAIGTAAHTYATFSFDADKAPWKDLPSEALKVYKDMDDNGSLRSTVTVGATFVGAIRGLMAIAAAKGVCYLADQKTTIEVKRAL
jgi:hypothetical protein